MFVDETHIDMRFLLVISLIFPNHPEFSGLNPFILSWLHPRNSSLPIASRNIPNKKNILRYHLHPHTFQHLPPTSQPHIRPPPKKSHRPHGWPVPIPADRPASVARTLQRCPRQGEALGEGVIGDFVCSETFGDDQLVYTKIIPFRS